MSTKPKFASINPVLLDPRAWERFQGVNEILDNFAALNSQAGYTDGAHNNIANNEGAVGGGGTGGTPVADSPAGGKTNSQIIEQLVLKPEQKGKLSKLLERAKINVSDYGSIDDFFEAVRKEADGGTLGKGGQSAQNRYNTITKLMSAGGINAPGGAGGAPIFENPQLSSIKVAMGAEDPTLGSVPDQAQQIQNFLQQQRGQFIGQLPGQVQPQMPFATGPGYGIDVSTQGLLSQGTKEGKAALKKLGLLGGK